MHFIGLPLVACLLWIPPMVCLDPTAMAAMSECRKLINLERLAFCCGVSLVDKFLFVGSNCTDYWNNFGACRYECLYKHWNLLDENYVIKKPELYTMITSLYNPLNGYNQYGTAFKDANEDCEKLGTNYTAFVMTFANDKQKELGLDTQCRPEAMLHSQCVMVHVAQHCPKELWKAVTECDDLRALIPNCIPDLVPPYMYLVPEYVNEVERQMDVSTDGTNNPMALRGYLFLLSSLLSLVLSQMSD